MEINGRVYDAKSGHVLRLDKSKKTVVNHKTIDGFKKSAKPLDLSKAKKATSRQNTTASKNVHKKKSGTQRLHPAIRESQAKKAQKPKIRKFAGKKLDTKERADRAKVTKKSSKIQKHAKTTPAAAAQPNAKAAQSEVAPPMPSFVRAGYAKATAAKEQPKQPAQPELAEDESDSSVSWVKRHIVPAAASFAGLALLSGFLVYNSLPNLTMRVAASRAGFDASVPSYQPSGYSFEGPKSYGPGRVVISFESKTDDREYSITQRQSSWDSQSLLENFVSEHSENHVVFEEHGLTIYLYEKDKATWVDGGVWYQVEGTANLSSEQILKIAASL